MDISRLGSGRSKPSLNSHSMGRAKSCTCCRQAKLACDARKTLKTPCSRCRLKGLDCRFDANFKRVSTRKLTEEISQQLHALRSTEESSHAEHFLSKSAPNLQSITANESIAKSTEPPPCGANIQEHTLSWFATTGNDVARSYNLGALELEVQTVIELFQYFGMHYYPHATFLQPVTCLSDLLTASPLLFWTIILVASQDHHRFGPVYPDVATEHENLLAPILSKAIQRIETIHALLLLCLWPIPQSQYFQNPAWNYVGLAIHAAMQLHCHSPLVPGKEQDWWPGFSLVAEGEVDIVDQARTWLGCFRVGTAVAIFSGLPPPMSTEQHRRSIDQALHTMSGLVPYSWNTLVSILKTMNSTMDTLCNIEDQNSHFSVTEMFIEQLDVLKRTNLNRWDSELQVEWCNAKLYIFALTFTTPANEDPSKIIQGRMHRQRILRQAFEVASSLITEFLRLGQLRASEFQPSGLLKFVPELYFTSLFNATTFLFRFMATFMALTPVLGNQAVGLIIEAHKIFQAYPGHREFTRAAIHIEMLIDILKQSPPAGMSELVVKNKLGASVMFDAIYHACRQRNIDPRTGKPVAVKEWRTVTERFAERLPKIPGEMVESDGQGSVLPHDSLGMDQRFMPLGEQEAEWWEEWDKYVDLFRVGEEQMDEN